MDALRRRNKQALDQQTVQLPVVASKKRKTPASTEPSQPIASTSTISNNPPSLVPSKKRTKLIPSSTVPSTSTLASSSSAAAPRPTSEAEAEIERKRAKKERKLARQKKREAKEAKRKEKGKGKAVDLEPLPAPILPPPPSAKVTLEPTSSRLSLQLEALERLKKPVKVVKPRKAPVVKKKETKVARASSSSSSSVPKPLGAEATEESCDVITAFLKNKDDPRAIESLPKLVTEADHHAILTSKYISATDLNKLATSMGLKFKKGVFNQTEESLIKGAIEKYKQVHGLNEDKIVEIVFSKGRKERGDHPTFFQEITQALPDRPIIAVYHHLRRLYHPMKGQGPWSKEEDDKLRAGILTVGAKWELLEPIVGRSAFDCRDRFRNHIDGNDGSRKKGTWSLEEEDQLSNIVNEMTHGGGIGDDTGDEAEVYWSVVSEKMGFARGRSQCRQKWVDMGGVQVKPNGKDFTSTDAYILAQKLKKLNVETEKDVVWYDLRDANWKEWSGPQLLAAFSSLRKKLWHYKELSVRSFLDAAGLARVLLR
ncbi:hypothetical protein BDY24DRAFT_390630 [Mrakia frigida]|uniref:uncharacterized protein n=1 Tax=Mrakia frigida TaxID=29902 RepID=UPI003FCC01D4